MDIKIRSIEELNKFCRLCLSSTNDVCSVFERVSPFSEMLPNTQFSEMIMACVSINIQNGEEFPEMVCSVCLNNLSNFYNFKRQCERSDEILRQLVNNLKSIENTNKYLVLRESFEDILDSKDSINIVCEDGATLPENVSVMCVDEKSNTKTLKDPKSSNTYEAEDVKYFDDLRTDYDIKEEDDDYTFDTNNLDKRENNCVTKPNTNQYQCPFCFKIYDTKASFTRHENNFCKKRIFSCDVCFATFNEMTALQDHLSNEHKEESNIKFLTCDVCNKKFNSRPKLLSHFHWHLATGLFFDSYSKNGLQCYFCIKEFKTFKDLKKHIQTHQSKETTEFLCRKCEVYFDNDSTLREHLKKNHGIRIFTCNHCLIGFHYQPELVNHLKAHEMEQYKTTYSCCICENIYQQKIDLKLHLKEHLDCVYKCILCSKLYNSLTDTTAHYKTHEYLGSHVCPICGIVVSERRVHTHENGETKFETFTCVICDKQLKTKCSLKKHIRLHNEEKRYICSNCGARFFDIGDLNIHMRHHTGERPYPCKFPGCDKTFKTASHRCDHMRCHTGEKNYSCELCDSKFSRSGMLKLHVEAVHLNIHRFSCEYCERKFRRRHRLKEHMNKVHAHLGTS